LKALPQQLRSRNSKKFLNWGVNENWVCHSTIPPWAVQDSVRSKAFSLFHFPFLSCSFADSTSKCNSFNSLGTSAPQTLRRCAYCHSAVQLHFKLEFTIEAQPLIGLVAA
jgi:hypothetical protein